MQMPLIPALMETTLNVPIVSAKYGSIVLPKNDVALIVPVRVVELQRF
jgi:hypothetical protein